MAILYFLFLSLLFLIPVWYNLPYDFILIIKEMVVYMVKLQFKIKNNKYISLEPTKIIVFSFLAVIFCGAFLLNLPIASNPGQPPVNFLTALFTATSATCVTGLGVVDIATQWSGFGRMVIILLVQIGGLGLVTITTFFSVLLGKKVGIKGQILAQESLNHFSSVGVLKLIKRVISITFFIEFIGAVILSIKFIPRYGLRGIYLSFFHSISAFCNAGINFIDNYQSLTNFKNDPFVLLTTSSLIVIGGLGFLVWKDIYEFRKNKQFFVHTKVVLVSTTILLVFGTLSIFIFEHNNPYTLGNLSIPGKLLNSYFHSVSLRTAGFYSFPISGMYEITRVISILLMFIGASPGSTGGGIKVTTFAIIIAAIYSHTRGRDDTIVFKHKIPYNLVFKALTIIGLSFIIVITVTTLVLAIDGFPFIDTLYEITAAFSTVGISPIGTSNLHTVSKIAIIITMFIGRVGPLTFALSLSLRGGRKNEDLIYPEAKIVVG
jgi:trk system potassium uptake protein TrkH